VLSTFNSLIFCIFKLITDNVRCFNRIKFVSFGVRRLKNRSVTPNGEEIKDEKVGI
jgi:hypothetical protein